MTRSRLSALAIVASCVLTSGVGARAAAPATPTITVDPAPLTAETSGGCIDRTKKCYRVHGTADPGAKIIITAFDSSAPAYAITVTTLALSKSDPGTGDSAGDWAVSPGVTDLGGHGETPSIITYSAVSEVNGVRSASASTQVAKLSATSGDFKEPLISNKKAPPATWCHFGGGGGFGFTVPPGVLLAACLPTFPAFGIDTTNPTSGFRGYGAWSQTEISGVVDDHVDGDFGLASEIADVTITITKGTTLIREWHSFTRVATRAYYDAKVAIGDFEPGTYNWVVSATDAWGHKATNAQGSFNVSQL